MGMALCQFLALRKPHSSHCVLLPCEKSSYPAGEGPPKKGLEDDSSWRENTHEGASRCQTYEWGSHLHIPTQLNLHRTPAPLAIWWQLRERSSSQRSRRTAGLSSVSSQNHDNNEWFQAITFGVLCYTALDNWSTPPITLALSGWMVLLPYKAWSLVVMGTRLPALQAQRKSVKVVLVREWVPCSN